MNKLFERKIENLMKVYDELRFEINIEKANRDLSKLINLQNEFDERFDYFFDDIDLRKKYNDYDYKNKCIKFEKTTNDLLKLFDEEDLKKYVDFLHNLTDIQYDELQDLREGRKSEY